MKIDERLNLLYKVSEQYYGEGKTKAEIAGELRQSPTHVANLLKEAKAKGIVTIDLHVPTVSTLQDSLKQKFPHLVDAVVIPFDSDCRDLLKQLAQCAAEYFESRVEPGSTVAVGGGYLMYEMISQLSERERDINIYPVAIIGRGPTIAHIDPITLVTLLWAKSGRGKERAHYVTVTPPDGSTRKEIYKHYRLLDKSRKVLELFREMVNVDSVFLSIGGLNADPEYISIAQYSSQNLVLEMGMTKEELLAEGAIGDIGYSFFDADGSGKEQWEIGKAIGIDGLRKIARTPGKQVVAVVGAYKLASLQAVLKNKCCNVVITDSKAATRLIHNR